MIDKFAKKFWEPSSHARQLWLYEYMRGHVEFFQGSQGPAGHVFGSSSKMPNAKSMWYAFMMMVSFAMLNIEDKNASADQEIAPLIEVFSAEENYAEHMHALAWFLYGTLSQEVCVMYCAEYSNLCDVLILMLLWLCFEFLRVSWHCIRCTNRLRMRRVF